MYLLLLFFVLLCLPFLAFLKQGKALEAEGNTTLCKTFRGVWDVYSKSERS